MSVVGERLLIAATLEGVGVGEDVRRLPAHMSYHAGWLTYPSDHRYELQDRMDEVFDGRILLKGATGGERAMYGYNYALPGRMILGVEHYPWVAIHSLVKSRGGFLPPDSPFIDSFLPHVIDTPERAVAEDERLVFPSIVMISQSGDDPMKHVDVAYQRNPQTEAYERQA